jgi:hypothetical protein
VQQAQQELDFQREEEVEASLQQVSSHYQLDLENLAEVSVTVSIYVFGNLPVQVGTADIWLLEGDIHFFDHVGKISNIWLHQLFFQPY